MNIVKNLLGLFLQNNCPMCERTTDKEICQYCNKQLQNYQLQNPKIFWKPPLPIFAWGSYGGTLKRAIAVMKYENHPEIGRLLGQYLGEKWLLTFTLKNQNPVVVPIPMHSKKLKERGFNQAEIIAQGFCEITGFKLKANGLSRIKQTKAQIEVLGTERERNLANAFALGVDFKRHHPDSPILFIDDIYTTGATIKSAKHTLNQNNISVLGVATVAKAGKI